jgi:hypothetical protein
VLGVQAPDANETFISRYPDFFRSLPLFAGGIGFVSLLLNRLVSNVAPFLDGGSSQSRVDVLVIAMAATLALTGFQWLSLRPVEPKQVIFQSPVLCRVLQRPLSSASLQPILICSNDVTQCSRYIKWRDQSAVSGQVYITRYHS